MVLLRERDRDLSGPGDLSIGERLRDRLGVLERDLERRDDFDLTLAEGDEEREREDFLALDKLRLLDFPPLLDLDLDLESFFFFFFLLLLDDSSL